VTETVLELVYTVWVILTLTDTVSVTNNDSHSQSELKS